MHGCTRLTHLTFDFCPHDYPIIGAVAKGFQYHHFHPSAWTVVPIVTMLSHSFLLLGALSAALLAARPKPGFPRVFWSSAMAFCLLTVLTHRWVHLPAAETPACACRVLPSSVPLCFVLASRASTSLIVLGEFHDTSTGCHGHCRVSVAATARLTDGTGTPQATPPVVSRDSQERINDLVRMDIQL